MPNIDPTKIETNKPNDPKSSTVKNLGSIGRQNAVTPEKSKPTPLGVIGKQSAVPVAERFKALKQSENTRKDENTTTPTLY